MSIFISFVSLKGKFETVKEQQFPTLASALESVKKYATENGFSNVKVIHEVDYSVRFTARTPGGRNGRNIAFGDFDFDFTEDEEIAESKPSSAQLSTSVSPSDTRVTSRESLPASPAPSAANGGAGILYTVQHFEGHTQVCRWESAEIAAEYAASHRYIYAVDANHPAVALAAPHMRYARDERNVPLTTRNRER